MDAYGSGTSRRGEDAVTAAGVAAAGAVGGDDFAVGRVRARDLCAEGTFILIIVSVTSMGNWTDVVFCSQAPRCIECPLRETCPSARLYLPDVEDL